MGSLGPQCLPPFVSEGGICGEPIGSPCGRLRCLIHLNEWHLVLQQRQAVQSLWHLANRSLCLSQCFGLISTSKKGFSFKWNLTASWHLSLAWLADVHSPLQSYKLFMRLQMDLDGTEWRWGTSYGLYVNDFYTPPSKGSPPQQTAVFNHSENIHLVLESSLPWFSCMPQLQQKGGQ